MLRRVALEAKWAESSSLSIRRHRAPMSKLHPRARGHLTSISSRGVNQQDQASQAHRDLDEQKQALDERTAQLRAKRLAHKGTDPDAS